MIKRLRAILCNYFFDINVTASILTQRPRLLPATAQHPGGGAGRGGAAAAAGSPAEADVLALRHQPAPDQERHAPDGQADGAQRRHEQPGSVHAAAAAVGKAEKHQQAAQKAEKTKGGSVLWKFVCL